MNESQLTRKILKAIKIHHPDVWVYKTNDRFTSGIPDLIMCINGCFCAVELKSPQIKNSMPNKIQAFVLNNIDRADGATSICNSWIEVDEFIKSIKKGGD